MHSSTMGLVMTTKLLGNNNGIIASQTCKKDFNCPPWITVKSFGHGLNTCWTTFSDSKPKEMSISESEQLLQQAYIQLFLSCKTISKKQSWPQSLRTKWNQKPVYSLSRNLWTPKMQELWRTFATNMARTFPMINLWAWELNYVETNLGSNGVIWKASAYLRFKFNLFAMSRISRASVRSMTWQGPKSTTIITVIKLPTDIALTTNLLSSSGLTAQWHSASLLLQQGFSTQQQLLQNGIQKRHLLNTTTTLRSSTTQNSPALTQKFPTSFLTSIICSVLPMSSAPSRIIEFLLYSKTIWGISAFLSDCEALPMQELLENLSSGTMTSIFLKLKMPIPHSEETLQLLPMWPLTISTSQKKKQPLNWNGIPVKPILWWQASIKA